VPDNLFFFENRFAVGDFGLVSFEGKSADTAQGERIGPMFFMAPEMLNSAIEADGQFADVYSLAKTLWVMATGQRSPQPGRLGRQVLAPPSDFRRTADCRDDDPDPSWRDARPKGGRLRWSQ
jgi:hypothetical protein